VPFAPSTPDPVAAGRRALRGPPHDDELVALHRLRAAHQRIERVTRDGEVGARRDPQRLPRQELGRHADRVAPRLGAQHRERLRV
jgi:hypothetical protein